MKTTLCFLNDKIVALTGKASRKKVIIKSVKSYSLPDGSLVNGVINDENAVRKVLEYYSPASFSLTKKIYAVIESSSVFIKKLEVPQTSNKNLQKIVANSYISSENKNSNLLFDYCLIDNNQDSNKKQILTFAAEKDFIESYINAFKKSNTRLKKLDVSTDCMIKLTENSPRLNGRNYIAVVLDEPDVSIYIFVNNKYFYSTKIKLFCSFDTDNFYDELVSNISTVIQFTTSQNREIELKNAYIFGMTNAQINKLKVNLSDIKVNICSNDVFGRKVKYKRNANNAINCVYNIGALFGK